MVYRNHPFLPSFHPLGGNFRLKHISVHCMDWSEIWYIAFGCCQISTVCFTECCFFLHLGMIQKIFVTKILGLFVWIDLKTGMTLHLVDANYCKWFWVLFDINFLFIELCHILKEGNDRENFCVHVCAQFWTRKTRDWVHFQKP